MMTKEQVSTFLRSTWTKAGLVTHGLALLVLIAILVDARLLNGNLLLSRALANGLDAPDNWAIALNWFLRCVSLLAAGGFGCYAMALWRMQTKKGCRTTACT
jgi:hypothetical protein